MIESTHKTQDEATAVAIAACTAEGPGGVVVVHRQTCKMAGDDESTCTCTPTTLQLGARA